MTTRYQTIWRRVVAALVDSLVFLPFMAVDWGFGREQVGPIVAIVASVISYIGFYVYRILMHARYGQTVGKMVSKIVVVDVSETRLPSLRQAIDRDIVWLLLGLLSVCNIAGLMLTNEAQQVVEYRTDWWDVLAWMDTAWSWAIIISVLCSPQRRGIHDLMAGTVVIGCEHAALEKPNGFYVR